MKDFDEDFLRVDKKHLLLMQSEKGLLGGNVLGCWGFGGSGFSLIGHF